MILYYFNYKKKFFIPDYHRFSIFNTPLTERIRKRRAFADNELNSTIPPVTLFPYLMQENEFIATQYLDLTIRKINENRMNCNLVEDIQNNQDDTCQAAGTDSEIIENVKKPKLSFSIASIIGLNE